MRDFLVGSCAAVAIISFFLLVVGSPNHVTHHPVTSNENSWSHDLPSDEHGGWVENSSSSFSGGGVYGDALPIDEFGNELPDPDQPQALVGTYGVTVDDGLPEASGGLGWLNKCGELIPGSERGWHQRHPMDYGHMSGPPDIEDCNK